MLGIMRRATMERDARERGERRRAWRLKIAHRYNVIAFEPALLSPDLPPSYVPPRDAISHDEFCCAVLEHVASWMPDQVSRAIVDLEHAIVPRARRTLRCWLRGCAPRGACVLHPHCTDCQGRCVRCGKTIAPRATLRVT